MMRCPIMSGTVAPCFSASARNCARKLAHHVAIERHIVRDPEAVEDREQQQRVFGRLSERFRLFDQQTRPLHSRLGFRRGISFDMDEWSYERDLKLDLLRDAMRAWQARSRSESSARVSCSAASTSAERSSDRCPALPHRPAAFSISPASVQ